MRITDPIHSTGCAVWDAHAHQSCGQHNRSTQAQPEYGDAVGAAGAGATGGLLQSGGRPAAGQFELSCKKNGHCGGDGRGQDRAQEEGEEGTSNVPCDSCVHARCARVCAVLPSCGVGDSAALHPRTPMRLSHFFLHVLTHTWHMQYRRRRRRTKPS